MAEADFRLMTEATGQRIAAALEALHLATVTGVKGDAEQNYRHGDVNITPANIGAASDSAAMQYRGLYPNGQSMFSVAPGYYLTTDDTAPSEGLPAYGTGYGELSVSPTSDYPQIIWISALKDFSYWDNHNSQWVAIQREGVTPVTSGGTGATTPSGARTNLQINNGQCTANFDNGVVTYPPSRFGLYAGQPSVIIMTPCNTQCNLRYDWDNSVSNIIIHANYQDGTPITGAIRFSFIAIP